MQAESAESHPEASPLPNPNEPDAIPNSPPRLAAVRRLLPILLCLYGGAVMHGLTLVCRRLHPRRLWQRPAWPLMWLLTWQFWNH